MTALERRLAAKEKEAHITINEKEGRDYDVLKSDMLGEDLA